MIDDMLSSILTRMLPYLFSLNLHGVPGVDFFTVLQGYKLHHHREMVRQSTEILQKKSIFS